MSHQGNQHILVAQDYFSKWLFAQGMPDQKAERIVRILRDQVFTLVGPPEGLHSDQNRNFEHQKATLSLVVIGGIQQPALFG